MTKMLRKETLYYLISNYIIHKLHSRNKKYFKSSTQEEKKRHIKVILNKDFLSLNILFYEIYEKHLLNELMVFLKKNLNFDSKKATILDIGSNIGNHTLFFSSYFDQVIAVEPHPLAQAILKLNCQNLLNVKFFEIALGKSNSKQLLINHNANFANSHLSQFHKDVIPKVIDGSFSTTEIKMFTLDDFLKQEVLKPEVVKIDAEGSELDILRGGEFYFREKSPIILMELSESTFIGFKKNLLIEQLKLYGYTDFFTADYVIPIDEHVSFRKFCLNLLMSFYKKNSLQFNRSPYPEKGNHRIVIALNVNGPFNESKLI